MRILLVEDEPSAARMLAKGLREQAYAVDIAGDGARALYEMSITDYDAVVLDVMLPLQDGLSVCRQIRQAGSVVPAPPKARTVMPSMLLPVTLPAPE